MEDILRLSIHCRAEMVNMCDIYNAFEDQQPVLMQTPERILQVGHIVRAL